MNTLVQQIEISDSALSVQLSDGRTISAPLGWYPRLVHGTTVERNHFEFIGDGLGIHWPDLDEDISVENILNGKSSGESQKSFQRWLNSRVARATRQ